jgi:hypothetical protein
MSDFSESTGPITNIKMSFRYFCSFSFKFVCCLTTLSELKLHCFVDRMIHEYGAVGGTRIGRWKPKYLEKICPSATLSITNSTWPDLGSNPGRRGGKSVCCFHIYIYLIVFSLTRDVTISFLTGCEPIWALTLPRLLVAVSGWGDKWYYNNNLCFVLEEPSLSYRKNIMCISRHSFVAVHSFKIILI